VTHIAPQHIGKASGIFTTMRQLGGAFGVAILVAVFAGAGSYASPQAFSDGFVPAIAVAAALSLTGAIAGLAAPRRQDATVPVAAGTALETIPVPALLDTTAATHSPRPCP